MPRRGKKYKAVLEQRDPAPHGISDAIGALRELAWASFDETVEIAMVLGVDPRHADQMVRGTVVLPHGTGKSKRVLAIAGGEKYQEAEQAGADYVMTGPEAVEKIQGGFLDFEAVVATPDVMRDIGRLGKVLGPRGLMPNPKTGTVTMNIADAVNEIKAGKVEFKVNKTRIVHGVIGKRSFSDDQLRDNLNAFVGAVNRARPSAAKGRYIKTVHLSTTMSPSVELDLGEVEKVQQAERA
jgi:large subunit ribosomal protein L1